MRFYNPTDMRIGAGCVRQAGARLSQMGRRCLILTGAASAKQCGALADVCAALDSAQIEYAVFDGVPQNPSVEVCRAAGRQAARMDAGFLVGIGGGSPLDAAKASAVFASDPDLTEAALYAYDWPARTLPVVCVGTTAGTGSEVTPVSVLTNAAGRKQSIRDDRLYPTLSLGDARYTATQPPRLTCSCAVDAAAHCIESFFAQGAQEISRLFAARGAAMLAPVFHHICTDGAAALTDSERETLYVASIFGGFAISMTGTAFPHAMGYFLTEAYGVPHGVACAVYLPAFLRHAQACDRYSAQSFFVRTGCGAEEWISLLRGVTPACDVRLTEAQIEALRPRFVGNSGLARSPGAMTDADAVDLLRELFL